MSYLSARHWKLTLVSEELIRIRTRGSELSHSWPQEHQVSDRPIYHVPIYRQEKECISPCPGSYLVITW